MQRYLLVVLAVWGLIGKAYGVEERALKGTSVLGNRELPRSLYIVPWKTMPSDELKGRPTNSILDEVFQPLDRDVLLRQLRYQEESSPVE